ncbi:hypothetical protein [Candidatus Enterovibrio escicola]|uniref:hypothetical protein n=1 Tax=Candidatus Enterovibrio escicola TaxID=1927127 RepID=UPI0012382D06|nr:hypothetical protein [Candidatus Enterovibrio escacola]
MSEEIKSTGKNKLAQAMLDAAIESISEDINDIYTSIEKITNEIPKHIKVQLSSLKEDIESLKGDLKSVSEQFYVDLSRNINRILDVTSEIELQIEKQAEIHASAFNNKIEGYTVTSFWILLLWGLLCATVGGGIAGLMIWIEFKELAWYCNNLPKLHP